MQIACMLPVILIGRELEGGCTSFHEFAPFRHGLYPCMVSPYFRKDKTPLMGLGGVCVFLCCSGKREVFVLISFHGVA